jgi:hypothetical protein
MVQVKLAAAVLLGLIMVAALVQAPPMDPAEAYRSAGSSHSDLAGGGAGGGGAVGQLPDPPATPS